MDSVLKRANRFSAAWVYRIGTSPQKPGGGWLWAQPEFDDGHWQPPPHLGQAPLSKNQHELWARVRLSGPALSNPTLLLRLFGYGPEVYLDGQRQTLEELPHHRLDELHSGDRRALLHLGSAYAGKLLVIHIYANSQRIGVLEPVYLGEPAQLMAALFNDAAGVLFQAVIVLFIGFVASVLFLVIHVDSALIYFALLCFGNAAFLACTTGVVSLLFNSSIPTTVLFTFSGPVAAVGACSFVQAVLPAERWRFLRWPRNVVLLGIACELCAVAYDARLLAALTRPMLIVLGTTAVLVIIAAIRSAHEGYIEGKLICGGLAVGALLLLPDILTLSGAWSLPTHFVLTQAAMCMFLLSMGLVLIRRFMEVHKQLGKYSRTLGEQIKALERRNTEIEKLNDELRRQIEQRSDRMIEILTRSRSGSEGLSAPQKQLNVGELLGDHYRVVRSIGQGAMGCVYEVERTSDALHFAAKLMSAKADRSAMVRFVREARILAQLKHVNLVSIMDIDISLSGDLFLVMELVKGKTLKDEKGRYGEPEFAFLVLHQICAGLMAIHSQGITHRDLKPANILLAETAQGVLVKIADFGISTLGTNPEMAISSAQAVPKGSAASVLQKLGGRAVETSPPEQPQLPDENLPPGEADDGPTVNIPSGAVAPVKLTDEEADIPVNILPAMDKALAGVAPPELLHADNLTQTGILLGTPLYMAPELAGGSRKAPPASDIFSLGVIAFELLTGKLPLSVPAVVMVWEGRPLKIQKLSELRQDLPQEAVEVLDRCLDSNPDNRPTLAEIIAVLP